MIWPFEFRLLQGPYSTQQRNFEELCALLIKCKNPSWRVIPRESPDWGVDFLAKSKKKAIAYQCKFFIDSFGRSQIRQITTSIQKANQHKEQIGWSEYVLCIPKNLTAQQHSALEPIAKEHDVELSLMQANDIWALLIEFPSVQSAFFPVRVRDLPPYNSCAANLVLKQLANASEKSSADMIIPPNSLDPLDNRSRGLFLKAAGDLLSISGRHDQALTYYFEAEHFLSYPLDRSDLFRAISSIYSQSAQNDLAFQFWKRAEQSAPHELKASLRIDHAEYLLLHRQYPEVKKEISIGLRLAKESKNKDEVARAYVVLADLSFDSGDWQQAKRYYNLALRIWQQLGDNHQVASILSYLGSVLHRQGDLSTALERLTESVRVFEYVGDLPALAETLTSIGMVLFEMGEWYSSLQYHRRCLQIENIIPNPRGQSICFNNLGLLARVQGNYEEAVSYHQKALELSTKLKDPRGMVYSNSYLGLAYLDTNELSISREHFDGAMKLAKKVQFRFAEALSYLNLAQLAIRERRPNSALKYAMEGYEKIENVGGIIERARACRILAEAYLLKRHFNEALEYVQRSLAQFKKSGALYERAMSLVVLSQVQTELNHVESAKQTKARAEELLHKLGASAKLGNYDG